MDSHEDEGSEGEGREKSPSSLKKAVDGGALGAEGNTPNAKNPPSKDGTTKSSASEGQAAKSTGASGDKAKRTVKPIVDRSSSLATQHRINQAIKGSVQVANFNRLSGYLYDTSDREAKMQVVVFVDGVEKHTIK
ncbi:MAG: hypothetical protein KDB07_10020, partial [Planctomycetes bacterium]|nr:hypothetical protein [Planctomycetota bacterium]